MAFSTHKVIMDSEESIRRKIRTHSDGTKYIILNGTIFIVEKSHEEPFMKKMNGSGYHYTDIYKIVGEAILA